MMDHAAYRRALLADPDSQDADVLAHRAGCAECREFTERLNRFESRLERALKIDLPVTGTGAQVLPFQRRDAAPARPTWLAVAAGLVMALGVGGVLWLSGPRATLAADLVKHMEGELPAWDTTEAVPVRDVDDALKAERLRLKSTAGSVSYATDCPFRGHVVPHLVVQSGAGPVTVMVLVHESVRSATPFDEGGYRGTILPVKGHGSVAVLMQQKRTPDMDLQAVAAQVREAMVYER